jgi:hypothetical protein
LLFTKKELGVGGFQNKLSSVTDLQQSTEISLGISQLDMIMKKALQGLLDLYRWQ